MPIILEKNSTIAKKLINEGVDVISKEDAVHQDIREMHIGILNLMPDAALRVTECQFIKLIASCNKIIQIRIHIFTLNEIERSNETKKYIDISYETFEQVRKDGLDALIITGAPPFNEDILSEVYSESLAKVISWGLKNVTSIWVSCLSAQYVAKKNLNIDRKKMNRKLWGVFPHTICDSTHPLVKNMNSKFNCIHSRIYDVDETELQRHGFKTLIKCDVNQQFLLAVSPDGIKTILCQGHPEYDTISLFKEYKREINQYLKGIRLDYPPLPKAYFGKETEQTLNKYKKFLQQDNCTLNSADFLEDYFSHSEIYNTWIDTSKALFGNWIGLVYHMTGYERNDPGIKGEGLKPVLKL